MAHTNSASASNAGRKGKARSPWSRRPNVKTAINEARMREWRMRTMGWMLRTHLANLDRAIAAGWFERHNPAHVIERRNLLRSQDVAKHYANS